MGESLTLTESRYDKLLRTAKRGCQHWGKATTRPLPPTEFCPYNVSATCAHCKAYWNLVTWRFPQRWAIIKPNRIYIGGGTFRAHAVP